MKYEHRFCNSEFGDLKFSPDEVAVITLLLLRGAQTPGELRTRTNRMYEFADVAETEETLKKLSLREDGPFVVRLARNRVNAKVALCICLVGTLLRHRWQGKRLKRITTPLKPNPVKRIPLKI